MERYRDSAAIWSKQCSQMVQAGAAFSCCAVGAVLLRALRNTRPALLKRIFFVRHGHAQHNDITEKALKAGKQFGEAVTEGALIRDPALTPKGEGQAHAIAEDPVLRPAIVAGPHHAQAIIVSPQRRTLQTAVLGLGACEPAIPFIASADCQECSDLASDPGRPVPELQKEFPTVDFSQVEPPDAWFSKPGPWDFLTGTARADGVEALSERCKRFTTWLARRPEERMIVVTHHTFLAWLLEKEFSNCEVLEMGLLQDCTWRVLNSKGPLRALFKGDVPLTICGSSPLSGTATKALY